MTAFQFGQLLGAAMPLFVIVYFIAMLVFSFLFPWLAISAMRNIKLIRQQLERLNDNIEARGTTRGPGTLGL